MKRLIMASITAVVVIAVLAGTLIPILDDATATEDTFTNSGYYYMDLINADTNTTVTWEKTNPNYISVDGTDINMSEFAETGKAYSIVATDTGLVRYSIESGVQTSFQIYTGNSYNSATLTGTGDSVTVTITDGNVTYVKTTSGVEDTQTMEFTTGFVISPTETDYIMKNANESAYVLDDSNVYLCGTTGNGQYALGTYGYGTYDSITLTNIYCHGSISSVTYSNIVSVNSAVSDHVDLYLLDKFTFVMTADDTDTDVTYSYFIVPAEVTAERAVHFTDGENAIFNVIPVMIIIALLLGVVALVLRSRMD